MALAIGAGLTEALGRLEGRFGSGIVLPGPRARERRDSRRVSLGVASLDALLDGGIVAGEPLALRGSTTSGALTLALRAIASAQARGGEVAWLDLARSFDVVAAMRAGADLERLLLLRPPRESAALALSALARSGAFSLVVVDLGPGVLSRGRSDLARGDGRDGGLALRSGVSAHLAQALVQAGANKVPTLVLAERDARVDLPALEARRVEWLRWRGRIVGWRSQVSVAHSVRAASLCFLPLALPPADLVDEGLRARSGEIAEGEAVAARAAAGEVIDIRTAPHEVVDFESASARLGEVAG